MIGLVLLLLVTGVLDTFVTGRIDHWIPLLFGIYVGCLVVRLLGSDE